MDCDPLVKIQLFSVRLHALGDGCTIELLIMSNEWRILHTHIYATKIDSDNKAFHYVKPICLHVTCYKFQQSTFT